MHHHALPQPRKRFGQHFLVGDSVVDKIVDSLHLERHEAVLEIGPGRGALTVKLMAKLDRLYAIELDRDLAQRLRENYTDPPLHLIECDALDFDYASIPVLHQQWLSDKKTDKTASTTPDALLRYRLVGNLPYNVATPLIFCFIEAIAHVQDITIMVQKEVAKRMLSTHKEEDYGRLSVMVQYFFRVEKVLDVKPGAFFPPPKVQSMVIRLIPRPEFERQQCQPKTLEAIVKAAFGQRRKKLSNALSDFFTGEALGDLAHARAEDISLAQFVALANQYHKDHQEKFD